MKLFSSLVAIFLLYAPLNVVGEAPGLKYPAVNAYVRSFQNLINDSGSRRRVVQAASSVLALADRGIVQPLAQAIASPILDYLLVDETSRAAKSEGEERTKQQKAKKYYDTWLKMPILGFTFSCLMKMYEKENPRMDIFSHVL